MIRYKLPGTVKQVSLLEDGKAQVMLGIQKDPKSIFREYVIIEVSLDHARRLAPGTPFTVTFDIEAPDAATSGDTSRDPAALPAR